MRTAYFVGRLEHELVPDREEIVRYERCRELRQELGGRLLPPEPTLEHGERSGSATIAGIDRDQLAVQHETRAQSAKGGHHLRIPVRDLVQRAREQPHLFPV